MVTIFAFMATTAKSDICSVVIVLRSQVWILRIEENNLSARILSSLMFGKKMLFARFASSVDTEMDS